MYGSGKKKDEYDRIYNYESNEIDYEEPDENEDPEVVIDRLRNTIGRGDCLYCNSKHAMEYDGQICFICKMCGRSVHEDIYYRWAAGYLIDLED